jgi:hypothetical protein
VKGEVRVPMILVATRSDLCCAVANSGAVRSWCRRNEVPFVATSAKEDINCALVIRIMAQLVSHHNNTRT